MLASQSGHSETVQVLLASKAKVNVRTNGQTALNLAIENEHPEIAKLLLPYVISVDLKNSDKFTPLQLAAANGLTDVVELLLQKNAKVNFRAPDGSTSLLMASKSGNTKTAHVLLKNGAAVDLHDNNGCTPLIAASAHGHVKLVKLLLEYNAEVDLQLYSSGETALIIASRKGYTSIVKLLLNDQETESVSTIHSKSALSITLGKRKTFDSDGRTTEVDSSKKMKVCSETEILAVDEKNESVATSNSVSIQHRANVHILSKVKHSALSKAIRSRHTDIVKLLLKHKACISDTDLMDACKRDSLEIVELLLPHLKDDADGMIKSIALWWATRFDRKNIAILLLKNGADPNLYEIVPESDRNSDPHDPSLLPVLVVATLREDVEIVQLLLENGANADIEFGTNCMITPLMIAILRNHYQLVQLFVKHGANISFKARMKYRATHSSNQEFTYLDLANCIRNRKIITILRGATTEPNISSESLKVTVPHYDDNIMEGIISLVRNEYEHFRGLVRSQSQSQKNMSEVVGKKLLNLFPQSESEEDTCSDNENDRNILQKPQIIPPSVDECYRALLPKVAAKWKNIGVLLKIEYTKLEKIGADKKDSADGLLEMLVEWLKRVDPPPTWDELVKAIEPFDQSTAHEIHTKYVTVSVIDETPPKD